jgi:hypothetical protein
MARHLALALVGAVALFAVAQGCSSTSAAAGACALGAACSSTDLCTGGISGCGSNCQCLGGKWQAPCPTDLPQTGNACTPEGAECGYVTSTNACEADNCYCQGGAWNCEPSCAIGDASTSADAGDCIDDATVKLIQASDYDQSCTVDTDCLLISVGNACVPCAFSCPSGAAINVSAQSKYRSDIANTPAVCPANCPNEPDPCCVGGKCQASTTGQCPAADAGDAAPQTGADAATDGATEGGPFDASGE